MRARPSYPELEENLRHAKELTPFIETLSQYLKNRPNRINVTYEFWKGDKAGDVRSWMFGLKRNLFIDKLNGAIKEYDKAIAQEGQDHESARVLLGTIDDLIKEGLINYRSVLYGSSSALCKILTDLQLAVDCATERHETDEVKPRP